MPLGATQLAGLIFACLLSTYVRNTRLIAMITLLIISLIGNVMVYKISNDNPWGRLVGIWLLSPFGANIPISLSIIVSNVGGFTKKATVSAMLFIGYCVGNIIGPQFFFTSESPAYPVSFLRLQKFYYKTNNYIDWYPCHVSRLLSWRFLLGHFALLLYL